jgi:broad specificity phosphatase PhoE
LRLGSGVRQHQRLQRTQETAEIIRAVIKEKMAKDIEIITDQRIREENFGDMDGQSIATHDAYRVTVEEKISKKFPNGENFLDIKNRAANFLYEIDKKYENKVITNEHKPVQ